MARMLRHRSSEPLARARATLKDRLLHQMMDDLAEELSDADHAAAEALARHDTSEAVAATREAVRRRLLDRARGLALEELSDAPELDEPVAPDDALAPLTEAYRKAFHATARDQAATDLAERPEASDLEDLAPDALNALAKAYERALHAEALRRATEALDFSSITADDLPADVMDGLRATIKQRLLDQLFAQALDEIHEEVADPDADAFAEAFVTESFAPEASETASFASDVPQPEPAPSILGEAAFELDVLPQEEALAETTPASEAGEATEPADAEERFEQGVELSLPEEEAGSGFFLDASAVDDAALTDSDPGEGERDGWEAPILGEASADLDTLEARGDGFAEAALPASPEPASVLYLYGVRSHDAPIEPGALPDEGIDPEHPIFEISVDGVHAFVSEVSAAEFGAEAMALNRMDPDWVARHEQCHQLLIDSLSQFASFLPVPFGSVYADSAAVTELLSQVSYLEEVERLKNRSQWRLRVFRDRDRLHKHVVEHSGAVKDLMAGIRSQPRGESGGLKKQMVAAIHDEIDAMTERCTGHVHDRFGALADEVRPHDPGDDALPHAELLIDASYLVVNDRRDAFGDAVDELRQEFGEAGFTVEVSGPAPPALFATLAPPQPTAGG